MLNKDSQTAAYNQLPMPNDLPIIDQIPYLMLKLLYYLFQNKEVDMDTSKLLKEKVLSYPSLPNKEKAGLLRFCIANEFEQTKQVANFEDLKALVMEYMSLPISNDIDAVQQMIDGWSDRRW